MSKINILSSKIFNRIAAGEVVERPFSVVKELVENSIDSGAKNITIEIIDGGKSRITIIDDGCGIEKSELKKAILPHATSKISSISDLDNIETLGFRGEALASIASVSKLTIKSKPQNQQDGAEINVNGGEILGVLDCGCANGTEITVANLFYNTPAREKFLKTSRSEESEITATIARFILGNPEISFKYVSDGKVIYQSFGDGLKAAMSCVYGSKILNDCFFIETEKHGILIKGYIGKHYFTKANRSYQTLFLNGRYVVNQTVSLSIANAYSAYLMKRQYPFYVLSLTMPSETVDVNVHPNKLDVRFVDNRVVYSAIYSVISNVLDGSSSVLDIVVDDDNKKILNNEKPLNYVTHNNVKSKDDTFKLMFSDSCVDGKNKVSKNFEFNNILKKKSTTELFFGENKEGDIVDIFAENKAYIEKLEKEKNQNISNDNIKEKIEVSPVSMDIKRDLIFKGQVLNTYLIFDNGVDIFFIDQHAAHERLLFDEFKEQFSLAVVETQPLLFPFVLNVNAMEYSFLYEKMDILNSMGIEISYFGGTTFKISSVPIFLSSMNLEKFFNEILSEINTLKTLTIDDILKEKIAQKACKAAIKAGDKLTEKDIEILLDKLNYNLGLKCPHGRPIAIKITGTEVEKWFKRIV